MSALDRTPPTGVEVTLHEAERNDGYRDSGRRFDRRVLEIRWKWGGEPAALFFLVVGLGFLFFVAGVGESIASSRAWSATPVAESIRTLAPAAVFLTMVAAPGTGLTYYAVASFVNRSILRADENAIVVRHRPLPATHSMVLPVPGIDRIYVDTRSSWRGGHTRHVVVAERATGDVTILVSGESPERSEYIACALRERLQLPR